MLPTTDKMAMCIARTQRTLRSAGWRVLTCEPSVVEDLSNKVRLQEHAHRIGLSASLPKRYSSAETAHYPCVLKAARGQHGQAVFIVDDPRDVREHAPRGVEDEWVLQELICGHVEYSAALLVYRGAVVDSTLAEYTYEKQIYIWPLVGELSRTTLDGIPKTHLRVMKKFLKGFSGICNFNYKVRPSGEICVFEVNTRVGADLACDINRDRARLFFLALDELPG